MAVATASASVVLGMSEPSPVVEALHNKNAAIQLLHGNAQGQTAQRVRMYIKDRPAMDVFPTIAGTVAKYAAGGGLAGMGIGAAVGLGHPLAVGVGGAAGAVIGAGFGCHAAYKQQQYQYKDWLAKATNKAINDEVLGIVKKMVKDEINGNMSQYADLLDPINDNFMQRPVIDPTNGKVIDYAQHHKWIGENHRSLFSYQKLELRDLKLCYTTCGRLHRMYSQVLKGEVNGAQLNAEQKKCVVLLLKDLERDIAYYYKEARADADRLLDAGKLHPQDHADRLSQIAKMLYPR